MSANYSKGQKKDEFTHDNPVMGKISYFLPMKIESCVVNAQKLFIRKPTSTENAIILWTSFSTNQQNFRVAPQNS